MVAGFKNMKGWKWMLETFRLGMGFGFLARCVINLHGSLPRGSDGFCVGFQSGTSASRRVPGVDAAGQGAGLPGCKILFNLLIQQIRVNDHSTALPGPHTDQLMNL